MHHNQATLWKGLAFLLAIFLLGGLLLGCAVLLLGASRFGMLGWGGRPHAEMYQEPAAPVTPWGGPGRFFGFRPFCGLGPLFHLVGLLLIVGLIARLFHHRRWRAYGCPKGYGPGDKHEHHHHGPHGHWHHGPCCEHGYHEHPGEHAGETQETDETQPGGQETQDFKVG